MSRANRPDRPPQGGPACSRLRFPYVYGRLFHDRLPRLAGLAVFGPPASQSSGQLNSRPPQAEAAHPSYRNPTTFRLYITRPTTGLPFLPSIDRSEADHRYYGRARSAGTTCRSPPHVSKQIRSMRPQPRAFSHGS